MHKFVPIQTSLLLFRMSRPVGRKWGGDAMGAPAPLHRLRRSTIQLTDIASMTRERLPSLTLMHIHYVTDSDLD